MPLGKKSVLTIGKIGKPGLASFPLCVSISVQRKFASSLYEILNTPLYMCHVC